MPLKMELSTGTEGKRSSLEQTWALELSFQNIESYPVRQRFPSLSAPSEGQEGTSAHSHSISRFCMYHALACKMFAHNQFFFFSYYQAKHLK